MAKGKNEVALMQDELEQLAAAQVEAEKSGGPVFLSTKNGILSYKGNPINGNSIDVVILASPVERLYYKSRYDPNKPEGAVCFALGPTLSDLKPNAASTEPQHSQCVSCPKDQWGSSPTGGKGKACAEKRRLLIMTADSLSSVENIKIAEVAALRTAVTSVKPFATYLQTIASTTKRPLSSLITNISIVPDPKSQFKLQFNFVKLIDDMAIVRALIDRSTLELANAVATAGMDEGNDASEPSDPFELPATQSAKF
jgi:hypothetical protein